MRTIYSINDLYWAFTEMHSLDSIVIAGERKEYTLEDGHIIYLTEEEKRFLDAIKKFECVKAPEKPSGADVPPVSLVSDRILDSSEIVQKESGQTTLFGCWRSLKKYGLTGTMRQYAPGCMIQDVGRIDAAIDKAIDRAKKYCREYRHPLNRHQLEVTLDFTKEYLWESLGDSFRKALANAAKRLVCATGTDACDKFLCQFLLGHAKVGLKKYARAVLYTEESEFRPSGESPEFPEREELTNLDFTYGEELTQQQDALALQMHMLNMYRLMPGESAKCYGSDAIEIVPVTRAIAKKHASNDEVAWLYGSHFTLLNDAVIRGVERVMSFVKDGPFVGRIKDPNYRESVEVELRTQVSNRVRMEIATLDGKDFEHILKDLNTMHSRESYNPFHRYPGAIIMKRIRLAMHAEIWRIRARERFSI